MHVQIWGKPVLDLYVDSLPSVVVGRKNGTNQVGSEMKEKKISVPYTNVKQICMRFDSVVPRFVILM